MNFSDRFNDLKTRGREQYHILIFLTERRSYVNEHKREGHAKSCTLLLENNTKSILCEKGIVLTCLSLVLASRTMELIVHMSKSSIHAGSTIPRRVLNTYIHYCTTNQIFSRLNE